MHKTAPRYFERPVAPKVQPPVSGDQHYLPSTTYVATPPYADQTQGIDPNLATATRQDAIFARTLYAKEMVSAERAAQNRALTDQKIVHAHNYTPKEVKHIQEDINCSSQFVVKTAKCLQRPVDRTEQIKIPYNIYTRGGHPFDDYTGPHK